MGILIDPTPAEPDRGGSVKPALETVGHLLSLSFGDAAGSGYEAIKEFRTRMETLEQRVWTLWRESLALALPEFFVTASLTRRPDDVELARLLAEILAESETLAKAGRAEFMDVHRRTPTDFPLYPPLREKLPGWARKVAPEHLRDDERLRERLDRAFERGFRRAIADRGDHFAPILDFFEGDEAEPGKMRDAWQRYYDGLSQEIEEKPLFNQPEDGSGATLGQIFQPLRCYWRARAKRSRRDQLEDENKPDTVHVNWLQSELEDWLAARRSSDALRVVTGGPGSGKSSSALWFARDVAFAGSFNVFVVRLQGLDVGRSIPEIVRDIVDFGSDHRMLEDSPLDWLRDDAKPLLLVFDGLDEVARPDGAGLEVTKTFIRTLHGYLGSTNREVKAKLIALVLGRPQAAEEAALAMGGTLGDQALLHVAPLSRLDGNSLGRGGQTSEIVILDSRMLIDDDFRGTYYERYRPFDSSCYGNGTPEALRDQGLADMTVEPLLLYLLIISGFAGEDWELAKDNRNRVYQKIFEDIHDRDLKKPVGHSSKMGIEDEGDFFALMECLGLATWLRGGRSGSDEDFALVRDEVYLPERAGDFQDLPSAKLENVTLQTFTHRDDREAPGYAFVHKSFGDYLIARALIEAGEKWCREYVPRHLELFSTHWLQLSGGEQLTDDILRFMVSEARMRTDNVDVARKRVANLVTIVDHTLRHGFPAHKELITLKGKVDWRRREIFQRNAEEALLALVLVWGEVAFPENLIDGDLENGGWKPGPIKFNWGPNGFARLYCRLSGYDGVSKRLCRRWSISSEACRTADFTDMDLFGVNLSGAILTMSDFSDSNLTHSDFIRANLAHAGFWESNLSNVNFSRAEMSSTYFVDANLTGAKLHDAYLVGAHFQSTNISGANFRGATMPGVDLSFCEIGDADFSEADVEEVDFRRTDLSRARGLTQEMIDKAFGNSETKLPDGLERPDHWKDDQ